MFYKIGFWIMLALVVFMGWVFMRSNPMKNQGASSWVEYYSADPAATIKFMSDAFGIVAEKSADAPDGMEYTTLKAAKQFWPFAGVMATPKMAAPGTMSYITVSDYAASHAKLTELGARAILTEQVAGGMMFGIYEIPGKVVIGIAEYRK